jgi:polyhydroxyalkanoate synthase
VHETPLVIFPPWINKFYILDLKAEQPDPLDRRAGLYTLFVVSWKNPDASYADVGLEDLHRRGLPAAIREVKEITGEDRSTPSATASRAPRCR